MPPASSLAAVGQAFDSRLAQTPNRNGAVSLVHYLPVRRGHPAKETRHDGGGTGQAPPALLALARVVEDDVAADGHEVLPAGPVEPTALFRMVAVDEHEVHRVLP